MFISDFIKLVYLVISDNGISCVPLFIHFSFTIVLWLKAYHKWKLHLHVEITKPNSVLDMGSANGRQCYIVTLFLIDWAHTQNDPCPPKFQQGFRSSSQNLTRYQLGLLFYCCTHQASCVSMLIFIICYLSRSSKIFQPFLCWIYCREKNTSTFSIISLIWYFAGTLNPVLLKTRTCWSYILHGMPGH